MADVLLSEDKEAGEPFVEVVIGTFVGRASTVGVVLVAVVVLEAVPVHDEVVQVVAAFARCPLPPFGGFSFVVVLLPLLR